MPIGTFTNRTHRHDSHEVRMPPAIRPMAPPATATAPNTPKARLCPRPAKLVAINDSAVARRWRRRPLEGARRPAASRRGGQAAQERGEEHQMPAMAARRGRGYRRPAHQQQEVTKVRV